MSDLEQLARETRSSIEVTRNAKQDYQWVAKIYFDSDVEGEREKALEQLSVIDRALRVTYLGQPS